MSNSDFEKDVQNELEDLSFEPSEGVWNRVEANLPEKNRRRWLLLFLPLLIAGGIFFIANFSKPSDEFRQSAPNTLAISQKSTEQSKPSSNPSSNKGNGISTLENSAKVKSVDNKNFRQAKPDALTVTDTRSQRSTDKIFSQGQTQSAKDDVVILSDPGSMAANIRNAIPEADVENASVSKPATTQELNERPDTSLFKNDSSVLSIVSLPKSDISTSTDKLDTTKKEVAKGKKERANPKWILGVTAGAGISNVKSGLFSNNEMYADVQSSGSSPGTPTSPASSNAKPARPSASLAFTAGLTLERNISSKITLQTGLNYNYLSNRIEVGSRIDSSGNFITNSGTAFVNSYYRNGSTGTYVNKLHFITIPFVLQFRPVDKFPLFGEAGLTTSILINSNILQYSASRNAYFQNEKSHNRIVAGMQAGIGAHLKSMRVGYRFNYGLGTVVKDGSAQHPVSSMIYLQLPLKKF